MNKDTSLGEYIIEFIIVISIITILINSILYFINKNNIHLYILLFSLFLIGMLTLILVFKYGDEDKTLENYVILEKLEYENLKDTLYKQNYEIKKQNNIINKIKAIIK